MAKFREILRNPVVTALIGGLVAFTILILLWRGLGQWYRIRLLTEQRATAREEVSLRGNALSAAVNRRFALVDGLHAFVQAEADNEDIEAKFETFASRLQTSTLGIRNIALAPVGIIRYIYPIEGNEQVIGYEPSADPRPEIRTDVQQAIETGEIILSGPYELIQGGQGLIARQAVFIGKDYWGLVNIVFDLDPILNRAGLDRPADDLEFALRDDVGRLLFGSERIYEQDPVYYRFEFPEGIWELAAVPIGGWQSAIFDNLLVYQITGIIIVALLTGLIYLSINRQASLALMVQQRTHEIAKINLQLQADIDNRKQVEADLREKEEQYRSIFESTSDGLFIHDLDGNLVDFNPAASQMHEYTVEEFRRLKPAQFIHPDSISVFSEYIEAIKSGRRFRGRAVDLCKDGSVIYVEVFGRRFNYKGQPHSLAVVRDITEEAKAYQLLEQRVAERTRELSALLEVTRTVASTLELRPLLTLILEQLKTVINYTGAAIAQLNGDNFIFLDYQGPASKAQIMQLNIPIDQPSGYQEVFRTRNPVICADIWESPSDCWEIQDDDIAEDNFKYARSWMGVPLMIKDSFIGVLRLDHAEPGYFTDRDANLVHAFANQAAVAIENAQLYAQAQSLASLRERQKLARELHDSVSQALYGIALGARTARTLLDRPDSDDVQLTEPLDYVLSLAEAALVEMRALIFELRPETLETEGLSNAINKQAMALHTRHGLKVHTQLCEEPPVSIEIKEALYRVAQEAINNILKHAKASEIEINMLCNHDSLLIEIKDNGRGFDPGGDYTGHLGLRTMRERLEQVGGNLQIESVLGQGTSIKAAIRIDTK